jgi:hypothetical protein
MLFNHEKYSKKHNKCIIIPLSKSIETPSCVSEMQDKSEDRDRPGLTDCFDGPVPLTVS